MAKKTGKTPKEWFRQAEYDLDTASAMFESGRYIYTIFMCHLAIEKAIKGIYTRELKEIPPKTHDLIYLIARAKIELTEQYKDFIKILNDVSVPTRYPDDLSRLIKEYNEIRTINLLSKSGAVLKWLKEKL